MFGRFVPVPYDFGKTLAAEPKEQIVLRDNLTGGTRKVQREGRHVAAQIIDVEDQIVGQIGFVAPDDPTDSQRREAVFVSRGVDRTHACQAKVPDQIRFDERRGKPARCGIDMHGNIEVGLKLELVQSRRDFGHRLVVAGERDAERWRDADGIFVGPLHHLLRCHPAPVAFKRDFPQFNVEIAGEFVPTNLDGAGDNVRSSGRFSGGDHPLAPFPF